MSDSWLLTMDGEEIASCNTIHHGWLNHILLSDTMFNVYHPVAPRKHDAISDGSRKRDGLSDVLWTDRRRPVIENV